MDTDLHGRSTPPARTARSAHRHNRRLSPAGPRCHAVAGIPGALIGAVVPQPVVRPQRANAKSQADRLFMRSTLIRTMPRML